MSVFKKIYKKTSSDVYDEIASAGSETTELNVFDKIDGNYPNGLIPAPPKSTDPMFFNSLAQWQNFHFTGSAYRENNGYYLIAGIGTVGSINTEKWDPLLPKERLMTKEEYNKIEQLKGGYSLLDSDHSIYIDSEFNKYSKLYGNSMSRYNSDPNNNTVTVSTSAHSKVSTLNNTESTRIRLNTNFYGKALYVDENSLDIFSGHGITLTFSGTSGGIKINSNKLSNVLLAGTFRVSVNSGTKTYTAEIVPFLDGTRTAYQASAFLSGGNWYNTNIFTFIFDIPPKSDSTLIELYAKATSGTPKISLVDANFTVLSTPNNYFLVNNTTPITTTRNTL